jgi:hypothetical protein
MAGLSDVFGDNFGPSRRRVFAGVGLFFAGTAAVAAAVVLGTIGLDGMTTFEARRAAGTLAGLGVPATVLGVLAVLPASRRVYAAAAVGAGVCVLGVALFWTVFSSPFWAGTGGRPSYRLPVAVVYAFGGLVDVGALLAGLATVRERRAPGGTARLTVTERGRVEIVDASAGLRDRLVSSASAGGSVIADGVTDDLTDATVLDDGTATDGGGTVGAQRGTVRDAHILDDGAADDRESGGDRPPTERADTYCGNCTHFEYVRTSDGLEPYCGLDDERMSDVEACDDWTPNRTDGVSVGRTRGR